MGAFNPVMDHQTSPVPNDPADMQAAEIWKQAPSSGRWTWRQKSCSDCWIPIKLRTEFRQLETVFSNRDTHLVGFLMIRREICRAFVEFAPFDRLTGLGKWSSTNIPTGESADWTMLSNFTMARRTPSKHLSSIDQVKPLEVAFNPVTAVRRRVHWAGRHREQFTFCEHFSHSHHDHEYVIASANRSLGCWVTWCSPCGWCQKATRHSASSNWHKRNTTVTQFILLNFTELSIISFHFIRILFKTQNGVQLSNSVVA